MPRALGLAIPLVNRAGVPPGFPTFAQHHFPPTLPADHKSAKDVIRIFDLAVLLYSKSLPYCREILAANQRLMIVANHDPLVLGGLAYLFALERLAFSSPVHQISYINRICRNRINTPVLP